MVIYYMENGYFFIAAGGAVACSHERAYYYYIESIKSDCPFTAYPCKSAEEFHTGNCLRCYGDGCSRMGYNADKYSARGSLYLETESSSSYCGECITGSCQLMSICSIAYAYTHS